MTRANMKKRKRFNSGSEDVHMGMLDLLLHEPKTIFPACKYMKAPKSMIEFPPAVRRRKAV